MWLPSRMLCKVHQINECRSCSEMWSKSLKDSSHVLFLKTAWLRCSMNSVVTSVSTIGSWIVFQACSSAHETNHCVGFITIVVWHRLMDTDGYHRFTWCYVPSFSWWANEFCNIGSQKSKQLLFVLWVTEDVHPIARQLGLARNLSAHPFPYLFPDIFFQTVRNVRVPHNVQPCHILQLLLLVRDKHFVCIFIQGDDAGIGQALDNDSTIQDLSFVNSFWLLWLRLSRLFNTLCRGNRAYQNLRGKVGRTIS